MNPNNNNFDEKYFHFLAENPKPMTAVDLLETYPPQPKEVEDYGKPSDT